MRHRWAFVALVFGVLTHAWPQAGIKRIDLTNDVKGTWYLPRSADEIEKGSIHCKSSVAGFDLGWIQETPQTLYQDIEDARSFELPQAINVSSFVLEIVESNIGKGPTAEAMTLVLASDKNYMTGRFLLSLDKEEKPDYWFVKIPIMVRIWKKLPQLLVGIEKTPQIEIWIKKDDTDCITHVELIAYSHVSRSPMDPIGIECSTGFDCAVSLPYFPPAGSYSARK